jgi:CRP-like cAMP-binding protein
MEHRFIPSDQAPKPAGHRVNRILAALDPEDYALIEPHLEFVELTRGKVLFDAGETIHHTYFPHDSVVSLVTVMEDGDSVEMAVFGREALLGFVSAMVSRQSFGRYIVQISGTASRVPVDRLHEVVATRPSMRLLFLRFTEALLAQTFQTVACNAVHSVEARCCRWILSMHDRLDQDTLPLTHEFLAEMLGVQRSTVSLVTRTLQTAGLISQRRGFITVTDRAGLEDTTCECYDKIRRNFERLLPGTYTHR